MPHDHSLRAPSVLLGLCLVLAGCGERVAQQVTVEQHALLSDVTPAQWQTLAGRRIFFGHQSVGGNIMAGVADLLKANPQIRLKVVETAEADSNSGPGFYHALVGRNGDPQSKTDAFVRSAGRLGGGVAMLKYCYVDVNEQTDPAQLFEQYRRAVEDLRARHPGLTIVHVTLPLQIVENWKGILAAKLRGRTTFRDLDAIRNRYNALLRASYVHDPIFDLAKIESTHADGSRSFFVRGRDTVYALADELTSDGGHLNEVGRRAAAEQLLVLLARL